ncbi:hypothetical protein HA075_07365 [bacterium BFN5]|nr:hypothetical protein HA075_07235 [bacterium BFN5]QJW45685.1 hypothetical protein HA075_07365 [bacterium BFN5]
MDGMKRILLICLALLMVQSVCWAKIEKGSDHFEGTYWYYVDHSRSDSTMNYLISSFIVFFRQGDIYDGKGFEIAFLNDDGYAIGNTIKMQIDDTIFTWETAVDSYRGAFVRRSFPLPEPVYNALMTTQKDVAVRFYYYSLSGDYKKDYVIPFKTIKEAQGLFTKYVPKTASPTQAAQ